MMDLLRAVRLLLSAAPWAMARGAALSVLVLLMGVSLLALSGWFIVATAVAGAAGVGIAFDVFRPSAGVRLLALGRAGARYGERLLTHDATLRALAALRVDLLRRLVRLDARGMARLRGEAGLTRIIADVDALDGVVLRLMLPAVAAVITHVAVFAGLGLLVGWQVAGAVLLAWLVPGGLVLWWLGRGSLAPSAVAEAESQALNRDLIDMVRDRQALIVTGGLAAREDALLATDHRARMAARVLDRKDRRAALVLSLTGTLAVAVALVVGGALVADGTRGAAVAAIGLFAALALAETFAVLRRGVFDLGRMTDAARRVVPRAAPPQPVTRGTQAIPGAPVLHVAAPSLTLVPGQAVALTGPSGAGKSTLLLQIAGLLPAAPGRVHVCGIAPGDWDETALRKVLVMVPQRSALIAGSVRDNLSLACDAPDDAMWQALKAVSLDRAVAARGGLDAQLDEGGAGLSGGQARRLALARAMLGKPGLLLLDEPTEGLDADTADRVLHGLRTALPDAAILAALHRGADHAVFDRIVALEL